MSVYKRLRFPVFIALIVAGATFAAVSATGLGQSASEPKSKQKLAGGKIKSPKGRSGTIKILYGFLPERPVAAGQFSNVKVTCPNSHPRPLGGQYDTASNDLALITTVSTSSTSWGIGVKNLGSTEAKWRPGAICTK